MPSRDAVRRAMSVISRRAEYEYFFAKLESPDWIMPLAEEGLFRKPPDPVREGEYIQFPSWPESSYLSRVVAKAPDPVADVLDTIPLNDNYRVHMDLLDIALQLPSARAARWSKREAEWVSRQDWLPLLLPEKLATLSAFLVRSGYADEGLRIIRRLFEPRPGQSSESEDASGKLRFPPRPRALMDDWEYARAMSIVLPLLITAAPIAALEILSDLLSESVRLSTSDSEAPTDYSYIWRDRIEGHGDPDSDFRDSLINAIRDLSVAAAQAGQCAQVLEQLRGAQWDLFRRIELHVLRTACMDHAELAKAAVLKREWFANPVVFHEYVLLLRDAFPALTEAEQQTLLGWIDEGPDREAMAERHELFAGVRPDDDLMSQWVEQWQRDRLSPLRGALPETWSLRYAQYERKYGAPEFDYLQHKTSTHWVGETSPIAGDALRSMPREQLLSFLSSWTPEAGVDKPTRSGLAAELGMHDVEFFVAESETAADWCGLHPAYIAALLTGFEKALQANAQLTWSGVLGVCEYAAVLRSDDWDTRWTKRATAALLTTGLDHSSASIPREHSAHIWAVIRELLSRGAIEDTTRVSPDVDPLTAAINSLAGKALETAIRYAIWHKRTGDSSTQSNWTLLGQLPETSAALETIIDPASDYPVDARAIWGLQLEPLLWLDAGWVAEHSRMMLPEESDRAVQRDVVWNTYLAYGRPLDQIVQLFLHEYARSVEQLASGELAPTRSAGRDLGQKLAEHLMIYYLRGQITFSGSEDVLSRFYHAAPVAVRQHAFDFIGRSLRKTEELRQDVADRLQDLLERRLDAIRRISKPAVRRDAAAELQSWGWWFSSGRFETSWALDRLLDVLDLAGSIEPDRFVAQELNRLVESHPAEVALALRRMIEVVKAPYAIAGWKDEVRAILVALESSDNVRVREEVRRTVDALLERGFIEFREFATA